MMETNVFAPLEHASSGLAGLFGKSCLLRLGWLGHVRRMAPGRIPKDLLYGQLAVGTRPTGRPPPPLQRRVQEGPKRVPD